MSIPTKQIPLLLATLFIVSGCNEHVIRGSGPVKTETRDLGSGSFSKVKIDAPVDAKITVGGSPSLQLSGYSNVLRYLRSEIRGNTLHIFTEDDMDLRLKDDIVATITLPRLSGIDISGAGDVSVSGNVAVPEFNLDLSGAGSVEIQELHVQSFDAHMTGASNLKMHSGDITNGSYDIAGAGDILAFGVKHQNAGVEISGASNAEITANAKLVVDISGAGSVRYKGHPAIRKDVSGAGSVTDAN